VFLQRLSRRTRPQVLELGPGAGVAAAEIRGRLPECRLETVSLTPINPFLWLRSRDTSDPPGFSINRRQDPYIDLQHVGHIDQALPTIKQQFDFIYDCFGPFFWELIIASRNNCFQKAENLLQAVLDILTPGGILFVAASEGQLWTESILKQYSRPKDKLILLPPRYHTTQIRICILEKGRL
jgi:SAM-dependent methyltransferase